MTDGMRTTPSLFPVPTREDVLAHELAQACYTIEFLHGCLTDPIYSYEYPEQTLSHLKRWRAMTRNARECTAETARHSEPCPVHDDDFLALRSHMEAES